MLAQVVCINYRMGVKLAESCVWSLDRTISLGFQKVLSIEQLREHHPLLDMVDHNRRPKLPVSTSLVSASIHTVETTCTT